MKKKDIFFCIGAQKSGTTSLHDILSQNKNIALPKEKETHFFSLEELYENDHKKYFETYFDSKELKNAKIVGEIDPSYSYFKDTEKRIFKTFSSEYNIKFIFILRDPVKRAYSHFLMSQRRGYETLGFIQALEKEKSRINKDHFSNVNFSYLKRGFYSEQIDNYLKYFNLEDFLFIRFEEDFIKDRQLTFDRISDFLEIENFEYNIDHRSNPASVPKSKIIRDFIYKDIKLKKLISIIPVSNQFKKNIKKRIINLNLKESSSTKLDSDTLKELYLKNFIEEIDNLEKLIKLDLTNWKHN